MAHRTSFEGNIWKISTMKNLEKSSLETSVDLGYVKNGNKSVYQFIYGSQLYGTLFGVFARFHTKTSRNDNSYLIREISLLLINYHGTLNLGFTIHEPYFDGRDNVYFAVRGGEKLYKKRFKLDKTIEIEIGKQFPLVFNRILYPLPGFEFDINKRNSRDNSVPLKINIPATSVFDSEFQYRSGLDYYDNELRPGMLGFDGLSMESLRNTHPFPSGRCHQSNVSLKYS